MLYSELPIYKHGTELLGLALDVQQQMPRDFKRTLGANIQQLCVDMLQAMAAANAVRGPDRLHWLDKLLEHLRTTTALLRVSFERRMLSTRLWAKSVELLDAVGAQAGGWRRQTRRALGLADDGGDAMATSTGGTASVGPAADAPGAPARHQAGETGNLFSSLSTLPAPAV